MVHSVKRPGSAPSFGDRKTYQMDFHNKREGIKEALLDVEEGADIIMVKPAMAYQDVITEVRKVVNTPVAAYSVSGEYAMVKAGAKLGYIDEERIIGEMAVGAYRAGADIYLTIFCKRDCKRWMKGSWMMIKTEELFKKAVTLIPGGVNSRCVLLEVSAARRVLLNRQTVFI